MTRTEVIAIARDVGMCGMLTNVVCAIDELERFAALVAEAEREACAALALGLLLLGAPLARGGRVAWRWARVMGRWVLGGGRPRCRGFD